MSDLEMCQRVILYQNSLGQTDHIDDDDLAVHVFRTLVLEFVPNHK